ncbi:serine hydrolase domain-containing protein [Burkholderia cenocepacia]|uniref:serine hydrolase domain-containing protein n=1 Tax=Burkholderia cenocepacia TaxID=95486 RepID=UPI00285BA2AC|nr:serine hydrolase domain-containing protein [Burkholderia cenocepacia]MDR5644429.1 beta-lactamase family protein [Burkholderia cenocepacia]
MVNAKRNGVLDCILQQVTSRRGGVPGVVAMVTDRDANCYEGCAGVRTLGKDEQMTTDSVFSLFSTTKAMTAVVAMQLVEEGRIALDDPAGLYAPEIDQLQVFEDFSSDGRPRTRPPRRKILVNDLFLHTSGLGYEFFSEGDRAYRMFNDIPSIIESRFDSIRTVLLHDPGDSWTYGVGTDWLGLIVERVRGARLGDIMRDRLFGPLGMRDIGFRPSESMISRLTTSHDRAADGRLVPLPGLALPDPPQMDMGGGGLYSTVGEYMKFIRMILSEGAGSHGRVLKPETVRKMSEDGLARLGLSVGGWRTVNPSLANTGELLPGVDKGWCYMAMTNRTPAASGRSAGSFGWAGLANSYFWIDPAAGMGGYWATQILPFLDAASYPAFLEFEATVYRFL